MFKHIKTYNTILEEQKYLFDEYPINLQSDIEKILKILNKSYFKQFKIQIPQLNFVEKKDEIVYLKSHDFSGQQLGLIGLVTDSAYIILMLKLSESSKEAYGTFSVSWKGNSEEFADIKLSNNKILYKTINDENFEIIGTSSFAVGSSGIEINMK